MPRSDAQGINQPQRPHQDLSFAYLTLVIAPREPMFQGGLYSGEAVPPAPNTIETEGKQCPPNQSNGQSEQFNTIVERFAYFMRSIGVGCIFPHPLKFGLAALMHLCTHVGYDL